MTKIKEEIKNLSLQRDLLLGGAEAINVEINKLKKDLS